MSDANCDKCGQHIAYCVCPSEHSKIELYLKPPFYNELVEERDQLKAESTKYYDEMLKNQVALESAVKERDELHERYRLIKLANKEWTKNDAVTFGRLIDEKFHALESVRMAIEAMSKYSHVSWYSVVDETLAELKSRHQDLQ